MLANTDRNESADAMPAASRCHLPRYLVEYPVAYGNAVQQAIILHPCGSAS
jgi:hypothetical protein